MKVGDKINCWTIININPPPEHRYHILCRCVCGSEKWVSRSTLRRGKSKSCGCRKHRSQKEYNLKPGDNVGYWTILSNDGDKYRAYITVDRKQINLGTFGKLEDAVKARRNAEEQYFSERQKRVDKIKRAVMQKER